MQGRFVRAANVADASAIAEIHVATWRFAYRTLLPASFLASLSVEQRTEWWRQILSAEEPSTAVFVAGFYETIAGFCSVGQSDDDDAGRCTGHLHTLYVKSEFMNRGLGSLLLGEGLAALRSAGCLDATLWVLSGNIQARSFYEKHGWSPDGATKVEEIGAAGVEELRYGIRLECTP